MANPVENQLRQIDYIGLRAIWQTQTNLLIGKRKIQFVWGVIQSVSLTYNLTYGW